MKIQSAALYHIFLRSIIYWKHYILAVFRRFRPGYQYFGMFYPRIGGQTFECNSKHWTSRKNQLTFEAFELNPKWYIVQRDSCLTRLDIERPRQSLYPASAILKYNTMNRLNSEKQNFFLWIFFVVQIGYLIQ